MSITDELRTGGIYRFPSNRRVFTEEELTAIADRIDAEYQKVVDEWKAKDGQTWLNGYGECHAELMEGNDVIAASLEEAGWVKLPIDADGVPIRVGETVTCVLPFGGESKPFVVDRMELGRDGDGNVWSVALDRSTDCWEQPLLLRHHTPTVEDVLREFAAEVETAGGVMELPDAAIAEYAAKLRLAGDERWAGNSAAAYEIDGNAAAVHNQRAELAKLNALRAEDAETIRRLRRELEEERHGDD